MLTESFSGIRGIFGDSLTTALAKQYAEAYLYLLEHDKKLKSPALVVGHDTRASSRELAAIFIEVFVNAGCTVFDCGVAATPAIENSVRHFKAVGGVIVTASHNPAEYNGWKLLREDGAILSAADAARLIEYAHKKKSLSKASHKGEVKNVVIESRKAYIDFIVGLIGEKQQKKIRAAELAVICDAGGGAIIPYMKDVARSFGIRLIMHNATIGKFGRQIEPTPDSLRPLIPLIKKHRADFAIGFDADADRVELVLPDGTLVSGQHMVALVVESVLSAHEQPSSQTVVITDATSDLVHDVARRHGAGIQEVEVGEINVVDEMQELHSAVGGEGNSSGGVIAPQTCRDGLLAVAFIVRHMIITGKSIIEILNAYPNYHTVRAKARIDHGTPIKTSIEKYFSAIPEASISTTGDAFGGIKMRYKDNAWLWFRPSRTEPGNVHVFAESKNEARARALLQEGLGMIQKI